MKSRGPNRASLLPLPNLDELTSANGGMVRALRQPYSSNFTVCPHCCKHGRNGQLGTFTHLAPIVSRSDGESFHLILCDVPRSNPDPENGISSAPITVGFWYFHEQIGETQTIVVFLTRPPAFLASRLGQLNELADQLAATLPTSFAANYEFDGKRLVPVIF